MLFQEFVSSTLRMPTFLGSPIGGLQSVDAYLKDKMELLCLMGDILEHL